MAKQLSFTDEYGDEYPESYWRPVQINLNVEDKTGHVIFYGFKDAESANREGRRRVIGQRAYVLSTEDFIAHFEDTGSPARAAAEVTANPSGWNKLTSRLGTLFSAAPPADQAAEPVTEALEKSADAVKVSAYSLAASKKDVESSVKDKQGAPVLVSFFDQATDV